MPYYPFLSTIACTAAFLALVKADLYHDVKSLPAFDYDFIIVGGGTAGNVLANRLSAFSNVSVLVIEAGSSNEGVLSAEIPLFGPTLAPDTPFDWNYTTTPMAGLEGRSIPYARGRTLGGSSSINFMVYNRGSRDDWDSMASMTGDPGWSWDSMKPYMNANEKFEISAAVENEFLPDAHSASGMVSVSMQTFPTPLDSRVNDTITRLSSTFPHQIDMNAGNPIGFGWAQATIGDGQRSSSATSYLSSAYISRPNLSVLLNAEVTRVIQSASELAPVLEVQPLLNYQAPHFSTVEFESASRIYTVHAKKEVILCAGSFNSPKLLMLSGIGDDKALSNLGIPTIVDLPSVGQNMSDHVLLNNIYYVNSNDTIETYLNASMVNESITKWATTHQGPLANPLALFIGWMRLPEHDTIYTKYQDPTPGPTSAHYELVLSNGFPGLGAPANAHFMTLMTNLISPYSRGTVTLASSNPADAPIINPNLLDHPFDLYTMIAALESAKAFLSAPAWHDYVLGPWGPLANATTGAEMKSYVRQNSGTVWHAVGTAAMSPRGVSWGVVDPDLKVKETIGLRVVDASVIPHAPTGHTQGPVYLVAERAAAMILAEHY